MTGSLMSSNISQSSTELVNVTNMGMENKSCKACPVVHLQQSMTLERFWIEYTAFAQVDQFVFILNTHITNIMLFIVCIHILSILDSIKFPAGIQSSHQHRQ